MSHEMKLSEKEAEKHGELYKYIIDSVGPGHALPFFINSIICHLLHIINNDTDKFLTKKEIIELLNDIMKHITKRINELKDIE